MQTNDIRILINALSSEANTEHREYIKKQIISAGIAEELAADFMNPTTNDNSGGTGIYNLKTIWQGVEAVIITNHALDAMAVRTAGAEAVAVTDNDTDYFIKELEERTANNGGKAATLILCNEANSYINSQIKSACERLNISYIFADLNKKRMTPAEALAADKEALTKAIKSAAAEAANKPDEIARYIKQFMREDIEANKLAGCNKTGFINLDELSGGIHAGLYVVAAISSLGKTTFTHQIADNMAMSGKDVLFFSMEQSRLELVSKSLARQTAIAKGEPVTSLAIRNGYIPDSVKAAIDKYTTRTAGHMSIIEGNFNCNIKYITNYVRKYIHKNQCKPIVFIDYLQILQPENTKASGKEQIDHTITELKRMSREHGITVFVISSVNRSNYMTPIDFESLKESGGIEYTADVIWGLQLQCINDDLFSKASASIKDKREAIREAKAAMPRKIELSCLKNRYGIASYKCGFNYYPKYDLFDIDDSYRPESYTEQVKKNRTII